MSTLGIVTGIIAYIIDQKSGGILNSKTPDLDLIKYRNKPDNLIEEIQESSIN